MNLRTHALALAFLLSLVCAAPAQAGRVFLQAHGGWSFFNLDDVNAAVDAANEEAGEKKLDHIDSGLDAGFHVGYDLTDEVGLALGYSRLWGNSGFSGAGYNVEYDLPADLYEVSLDYLPVSDRKVRLGVGATLGMVRSAATVKVSDPDGGDRDDAFKGTGFLFAGYATAEAPMSSKWSLYGQGGFRHAAINELKVDDEVVLNPDSPDDKFRLSYSGFFLRVGIRLQL